MQPLLHMLKKQIELIAVADRIQRRKDLLHVADADPRRTINRVEEYVLLEYQATGLVKVRPKNGKSSEIDF